MRSEKDGSTPALNAFAEEFLEHFDQFDEPLTGPEAETVGPWRVLPVGTENGGWAVLRLGESPDQGDWPAAVFNRRERALLAAAVLPGTGRDPLYRLHTDAEAGGFFALEALGDGVAGYFRLFNEELKTALHVVDALVRSPLALSYLLEAAGPAALRQAGRLLRQRVES
ncbi:MAG TPA: hypothetical protein VJ725_11775 [Thermoanaerobaculia bacterium]|nr:hypothetical protein [Thermoanaerobaculia bacterium]